MRNQNKILNWQIKYFLSTVTFTYIQASSDGQYDIFTYDITLITNYTLKQSHVKL